MSAVEPHLVPHDWPADAGADVVNSSDVVYRREAAPAELVGDVHALEFRARIAGREIGREPVAAFLRHEVQLYAARRALGRLPAGFDHHFLHSRVVDEEV